MQLRLWTSGARHSDQHVTVNDGRGDWERGRLQRSREHETAGYRLRVFLICRALQRVFDERTLKRVDGAAQQQRQQTSKVGGSA